MRQVYFPILVFFYAFEINVSHLYYHKSSRRAHNCINSIEYLPNLERIRKIVLIKILLFHCKSIITLYKNTIGHRR